jgi:hypothetical protein
MTKRIAIEFAGYELKCDATGCGYVEPVQEISTGHIGKLCPKCGANLLTVEDFEAAKMIETLVAEINKNIWPVVSINAHNGSIAIKRMTVRPDMEPLANDLGCAPNPAQRMVEIDRNTFDEFQAIAKRTHTSVRAAINSALSQWLGRA